jgi:hypothetical protein
MANDDRVLTLYNDIDAAPIEELQRRFRQPCLGKASLEKYTGRHELDCVGGGFERCILCGLPSDPAEYRRAMAGMKGA